MLVTETEGDRVDSVTHFTAFVGFGDNDGLGVGEGLAEAGSAISKGSISVSRGFHGSGLVA